MTSQRVTSPFEELVGEELGAHASNLAVGDDHERRGSPEEGGAAITFAVLALCRYVEELTEQVTRIADNLCGEE